MSFYNTQNPDPFVILPKQAPSPYVPPGALIPFAGVRVPEGYLLCDGSDISREQYPSLFYAIDTLYGDGDGETTFTLPDLRGRVPVGQYEEDPYFDTLAGVGGQTDVALSSNQIPSHSHSVNDPGHVHTQTSMNDDFNNSAVGPNGGYSAFTTPSYPRSDSTGSVTWSQTINSASSGISVNNTGGGQTHTNVQPYITIQYIIKY
jgi:microcystin-dependent protein